MHQFVNDVERPIGTYLFGRRMYEVLVVWERPEAIVGSSPAMRDYAEIWQAADKIVYSGSLENAASTRTRIERKFEPEAIRQLKATTERDIGVGGPNLAAQAIAAGLVDEYHLFLSPVIMGGGNPALPDGVRVDLELLAERRFANGVVHLHYRARSRA